VRLPPPVAAIYEAVTELERSYEPEPRWR
jgi:hypothetical protein